MRTLFLSIIILFFSPMALSTAIIDADVLAQVEMRPMATNQVDSIAIIIFLKSPLQAGVFVEEINTIEGCTAEELRFMPAIAAVIPRQLNIINKIANHPLTAQISLHELGKEELEVSAQSILLRPSERYPDLRNWWSEGYTGENGVVGLIDSGVAVDHPGLSNTNILVRQEPNSNYDKFYQGVRSPHATGVACIYAGIGKGSFSQELGMAYGTSAIVAGLADNDAGEPAQLLLTITTLDWMLTRSDIKPTLINYSNGNGPVGCLTCRDWSALAKIVDYVVNHEKILWVKSAGNLGYTEPRNKRPFYSTMTTPADNYNAITVANMDTTAIQNGVNRQTPDRSRHAIRYTSSRGPTLNGRRKPDITAPGHDTLTCAPDPKQYPLTYTKEMNFHDGYRLMGGTSSAAPHVGGAILILQSAGIKNPIAAKALLINSADAWTDGGHAGPNDPIYPYEGDHHAVMGSEWNPTYGWGYLNMQQAFEQRQNIIESHLTPNFPSRDYYIVLPVGGKVTLVHERRVGYREDNTEWQLSHLSLELYDAETHALISQDNSSIDTVHQVANCDRTLGETRCSDKTMPLHAIVRVKLISPALDGSQTEPFALVFG